MIDVSKNIQAKYFRVFFPGTRNRFAYFRFGALPHGAKGVCDQFRYRGLGIISQHHSRRGLLLASRDMEVHDGSRSGVRDSQLFHKMVLSTTELYCLKEKNRLS